MARPDPARPVGIDLFAGAGGLSLGFTAAGFKIAAALDFDRSAIRTLRANHFVSPALVIKRDIRRFGPRAMATRLRGTSPNLKVDLIIGGPPCQGWSKVGRGKLRSLGRFGDGKDPFADPRNRLFTSFIRYVRHFLPRVCVMENVSGMAHYQGQDLTGLVRDRISSLGYRVAVSHIDASQLGLPQKRPRVIFVGLRDDLGRTFTPPSAAPSDLALRRQTVVRDAIRDLPWIRDGSRRESLRYFRDRKLARYARLLRPAWLNGTVDAHVTRWHRTQDIRAFRFLSEGGVYADLPQSFQRYRVDIFRDKYRRLAWDEPSPCLTAHLAKDCYSHIHPSQARTISIREAARLQGFPDWYQLEGNMGQRYRLIGNAVPPLVAYALAVSIRQQLGERVKYTWHELARDVARATGVDHGTAQ